MSFSFSCHPALPLICFARVRAVDSEGGLSHRACGNRHAEGGAGAGMLPSPEQRTWCPCVVREGITWEYDPGGRVLHSSQELPRLAKGSPWARHGRRGEVSGWSLAELCSRNTEVLPMPKVRGFVLLFLSPCLKP